MNTITQKEKAEAFHRLHHADEMLILPNVWDPLGAALLESLGYPAVATASASVALARGYDDGENIPFTDVLTLLKRITQSVNVPVSADVERGYASSDVELEQNIKLLIQAGIAGINIEDTDIKTGGLHTIAFQCDRIRLIKKVCGEMDIPLFINARSDVFLRDVHAGNETAQLDEIIQRGLAYKDAGADGFYPIALKQEKDIIKLMAQVDLPINIITLPGIPPLKALHKLGVARVSLGPSFLKTAVKAMKDIALQLKDYEGLSSITENDVTSVYLKNLVNKIKG